MKRIKNIFKTIYESFRISTSMQSKKLKYIGEILVAEHMVAESSSYDFVGVIGAEAQKLSKKTGVKYIDYLTEIKSMLDEGKSENDILWHFQKQLYTKEE